MRQIFAVFAMLGCAGAQQDIKVTYLATQASVQEVVKTLAHQAGYGYNWQKSFDQTNPECRQWTRDVRIDAVPFGTAMRQILDPVGLRYAVENGEVVLYRAPKAALAAEVLHKKITYSSGRKSVQSIVIDLAKQVGLGFNWDRSFAQTDPECRWFVDRVSIQNQPFDKAMKEILDPVGLAYRVEGDQVVLHRR